jgi:hypothetical protein
VTLTDYERYAACIEASKWIGTRHAHNTAIIGCGVDCGRLLIEIYSKIGAIERFDPGNYTRDWMYHNDRSIVLETVERYARKIDRHPISGDIVLFTFGRCISHCGMVVDAWPKIIHSYLPAKCVTYDSLESCLSPHIAGYWEVIKGGR